jgi:hypothetical protein
MQWAREQPNRVLDLVRRHRYDEMVVGGLEAITYASILLVIVSSHSLSYRSKFPEILHPLLNFALVANENYSRVIQDSLGR